MGLKRNRPAPIDTNLANSLRAVGASVKASQSGSAVRVVMLEAQKIQWNPENTRKIRIPLDVLQRALRVETETPLLHRDGSIIHFPSVDELQTDKSQDEINDYLAQPSNRRFYETMRSLCISIASHGLLQPVRVYKNDDGSFKLNFGHRRIYAVMLLISAHLHDPFIPSITSSSQTEFDDAITRWSENEDQDPLNFVERLENIRQIVNALEKETGQKVSGTKLSEILSVSESHARRYLNVLRSDFTKESFEFMDDYGIQDLRAVYEVSRLPQEMHLEALTYLVDNGPSATRDYVQRLLAGAADDNSDKSLDARVSASKRVSLKPNSQSVGGLVRLLGKASPELIQGLEAVQDNPKALLAEILKRIEKMESSVDD